MKRLILPGAMLALMLAVAATAIAQNDPAAKKLMLAVATTAIAQNDPAAKDISGASEPGAECVQADEGSDSVGCRLSKDVSEVSEPSEDASEAFETIEASEPGAECVQADESSDSVGCRRWVPEAGARS